MLWWNWNHARKSCRWYTKVGDMPFVVDILILPIEKSSLVFVYIYDKPGYAFLKK